MSRLTGCLLLGMVLLILLRGRLCGLDLYATFLAGARRGMENAWPLLPALCAMLLMVGMMNASGLTNLLVRLVTPLAQLLHLPEETAPMMILRPLSGSGSMAALERIFAEYGVDSRIGRISSVMMASSETIFYTLTVYGQASGGRKIRGVLGVSLIAYVVHLMVIGWLM